MRQNGKRAVNIEHGHSNTGALRGHGAASKAPNRTTRHTRSTARGERRQEANEAPATPGHKNAEPTEQATLFEPTAL
jgi:hypothetical protein